MPNGLAESIPPPVPDPTTLTTDQLLRTAQAERDYVDGRIQVLIERLSGMDRATELLSDTVTKVPTEVQREVGNLGAVVAEKFSSVDKQFAERDTRSEREARDNKLAVDAAFAAQEKQAVAESVSNQKAIDKSEVATNKAIDKLAELFESRVGSLGDSLGDLKNRVQAIESSRRGDITDAIRREAGENSQQDYQQQESLTANRMLAQAKNTLIASSIIGILGTIGIIAGAIVAVTG